MIYQGHFLFLGYQKEEEGGGTSVTNILVSVPGGLCWQPPPED